MASKPGAIVSKCKNDDDTNELGMKNISLSDHEYVIKGLHYWLNNQPKESEAFFKLKSDSTTILAGYAFVLCMNGVISYEVDKIDEAQKLLKTLETRCTTATTAAAYNVNNARTSNHPMAVQVLNSFNWLSNVRYKIFGNVTGINIQEACDSSVAGSKSTAQLFEEQLILADVYMSMAILTFLTQDITGLMKGSWLLRKAWKIYQKTYTQLYEMFVERFGDDSIQIPPMPLNYSQRLRFNIPRSLSHFNWINSSSSRDEFSTSTINRNMKGERTGERCAQPLQAFTAKSIGLNEVNAEDVKNEKVYDQVADGSQMGVLRTDAVQDDAILVDAIEKEFSPKCNRQSENYPSKKSLNLKLVDHDYGFIGPKTCPSTSGEKHTFQSLPCNSIDSVSLKRLMGAASFGYGLFQLTSSLLPAKLLKIISIFGFEGNRKIGVSCLMYARLSSDMRAILATLALLWFYTFGTQLFHNEDGYAKEKIEAVNSLLNECHEQYQNAAIFLFFRGRLERMKTNAHAAVEFFRKSYKFSAQNELKLLCLHEIAWCKLIQLDFSTAMKYFNEIRHVSVYSKAFYTYMTAICLGSIGNFDGLVTLKDEIVGLVRKLEQKQTHITTFIQNRTPKLPSDRTDKRFTESYWKYLCYEMLFLWSALSSVQPEHLSIIAEDCSMEHEDSFPEPMVGLRQLLHGGAQMALKNYQLAIDAYRQCILKRENISNQDMHITAFAHFELATLLLHSNGNSTQTKVEAKRLLQCAQKYQNYDLENRLCAQIQLELKNLM